MTRSPWAREYARTPDEYVWGTDPSPLAIEMSRLLAPGARVLELGCGEGRDSVFFASLGFEVAGVDVSAVGLRKAERLARERGVEVQWIHGDVARCPVAGPFDLVYSCGAIHYVPRRRRARLLQRLKALTRAGGHHAHIVFTDREVYVERGEIIDYFTPEELGRAYADWVILRCDEIVIPCRQDGTSHQHGAQELIARAGAASGF